MDYWIKPVARSVGITKPLGWHTFRHTFATLLKANGEDVKTVQELLRHASSRATLDLYAQADASQARRAEPGGKGIFSAGERLTLYALYEAIS